MPLARCQRVPAAVKDPIASAVEPPSFSRRSSKTVRIPRSAAEMAADNPAPPPPTTMTSQSSGMDIVSAELLRFGQVIALAGRRGGIRLRCTPALGQMCEQWAQENAGREQQQYHDYGTVPEDVEMARGQHQRLPQGLLGIRAKHERDHHRSDRDV